MSPSFKKLRAVLSDEKKQVNEIEKFYESLNKANEEEKDLLNTQIEILKKKIKETNGLLKTEFNKILFSEPLEIKKTPLKDNGPQILKTKTEIENSSEKLATKGGQKYTLKDIAPVGLEKETLKQIKWERERKKSHVEKEEGNEYTKIASQMFAKYSRKLLGNKSFKKLEYSLIHANLNYTPVGYVSVILFTTFISAMIAAFLFLFFLFFNIEAVLPIITRVTEPINIRFMKVIWLFFVVPVSTFVFMYFYPAMEKSSAEDAIDKELPFATIHMSAISGSMINPIKIFEIIIFTKEYPALSKEFTKMINEINLYGYDLVSALRNTAENSPSKTLAELLNGLSMAIHSGGDLSKFFEKRAQTLLFMYKLEQQKSSKSAETFMDMYISIVIAAPMILMLLMMIMKISGLGISMSINGIALLIIMGVVVVNIVFMTFLHLKKK